MTLDIEYKIGQKDKVYALVRNFPGLDAEMNEEKLRAMAQELLSAADKLQKENN